ncbi:glycosyltransferase family 4 protein [Vulcanisaeta distributa]|uniref:Glycosyl transferase group 1 n=1 Tax=Vulcanisaeta distributa (strain DSM 14429 / JCM 11212 / NBRC 100878 / IC-017) TaxID=572478 RepID=E1QUE3_VULDI|nr:glycosyltransferase family 4 protein [Vulcanisaeta distributa]ADN49869.1 glycosyl transferase group 1 [Vulcanisaeta distributa DSM 14429]
MRIVLLTTDYPPYSGGGIGTFTYELSKGLETFGNEVFIISKKHMINYNSQSLNEYFLTSPAIPPKDIWFYITRSYSITKLVKGLKPDVIHDVSGVTGYLPWISKIAPTIVTVHGTPLLGRIRLLMGGEDRIRSILFDLTHSIPARLVQIITKPDIKYIVFASKSALWDSLIGLDDKAKNGLLKKVHVVYNGVNINWLRDIAKSTTHVENYSVVFIGRLMEYKGVKWLVRAFRLVVNELSKAKLHIVGDGPIYRDIKDLVNKLDLENNVIMHGSLPRTEAMKVLAQSMVLTHPSLAEGFGIVIAEAYAMGKPVITHKSTYSYELVAETGAGLMVNTLNEREYADALIQLLTDENLYRKLSQRALEVSERFSMENMVKGYLKVYSKAINGS